MKALDFKARFFELTERAIALDIPRLKEKYEDTAFLSQISSRIAFLSWEECVGVILKHDSWLAEVKEWLIKFYEDRLLYLDPEKLPL